MDNQKPSMDDWLLDDQLGRLSETQHQQLVDAMADDPDLTARQQRVQRLLEPLDAWTTPPPPATLSDRILARITAHDSDAPVAPVLALPTGAEGGFSGRSPFSFRELLAVAAVIAFFGAILVPGISNVRTNSMRASCANNFGVIGRAVAAYAADHDDALAQASILPGARWLLHSDGGGPYSPNSRSPFLLLRYRYVQRPQVFVCPSCSDAKVMQVKNPHALADFPDPRNCSYVSLNMSGPTPLITSSPDQPYMADANPLFVGGRFHRVDPQTFSPNHRKSRGQNVLRLDGSAFWSVTPKYGARNDNIWQAGSVTIYLGTEVQTSENDTFLVP